MYASASKPRVKHLPGSVLTAVASLLLASPVLAETGDVVRLKSEQTQEALELDKSQDRYRRALDPGSLPRADRRALERELERERLQQHRLHQRQLSRERALHREQSRQPHLTSPDRTRDQVMRRERDAQRLQFKMRRNQRPPSRLE